ncbi:hypothetical protein CFK41_01405 [Brachybacterium ginsengisoli]|uniref:Glycoside hydrolase family 65 n=1 Tax=Brachybacterium ginsengisoli TaxID=1331682 RepID=A0A291GTP7_9MICO|nr:hypothetical protein [Brachybacterium ginsengisoli]ATG53585.1 hypothetical protein CFK41_01405 [Brachybacterium ginsengisoli]
MTTALRRGIDRRALVSRHDVVLTGIDPRSPLGTGNGNFAVTVDATGLQSLPTSYPVSPRDPAEDPGTLLGTLSTWGWHRNPDAAEFSWRDSLTWYDSDRGPVQYVDMHGSVSGGTEKGSGPQDLVLRGNPHRLDLGTIGFRRHGRPLELGEVVPVRQRLELLTGTITSQWEIEGHRVDVETCCDPQRSAVAARIRSSALQHGLSVALTFSYGNTAWHNAQDWGSPSRHGSATERLAEGLWRVERELDDTRYSVLLRSDAEVSSSEEHLVELTSPTPDMDLVLDFLPPGREDEPLDVDMVQERCASHWRDFWDSGAALDLGAVDDPRAEELERRVVLSQYLTAIHCSGEMPPQETGLVCNSWRGKSHLEMHWWHSAHFPLWGRPQLLRRSLSWYRTILPRALDMASLQGFEGARWPKQVGPEGEETPSGIAPFLIWQQTHPIHYVELLRRAAIHDQGGEAAREVTDEFDDLIRATADFMASFAIRTEHGYELPPPLIPAQESYGGMRREVRNPTFELIAWHWALGLACEWVRERGQEPPEKWVAVHEGMRAPTPRNGIYPAIGISPWTIRSDHPSMLCALGVLPGTALIDAGVMGATLDDVLSNWDWSSTWGWDYPVMAMTAARLGRPDQAVDLLLTDTGKNVVLANGHNRQTASLPLYLPGNGGLLSAIALMAGGWDGSPDRPCPGLPPDWDIRSEGFIPSP